MRAIIIASGRGAHLGALTEERPPCMVEVGGRPILHHQVEALQFWGIDDVVVIRGHRADAIAGPAGVPALRYVDDGDFEAHGMLASLFTAGAELVGDVVVSYGDVVYHAEAVEALLRSPAMGTLVVDRRWRASWRGRSQRATARAELCRATRDGLILDVGRHVGPAGATGEFVGLARFRAPMTARLWAAWERIRARGEDAPVGPARSLRAARLTDLVLELLDRGDLFAAATIDGGWRVLDAAVDHAPEPVALDG